VVAHGAGKGGILDGEGSGHRERVQEDEGWAAGSAVEPCLRFQASGSGCAKAVQEGLEGARRCTVRVLSLCRCGRVADDGEG
jgi:hypothetical protein